MHASADTPTNAPPSVSTSVVAAPHAMCSAAVAMGSPCARDGTSLDAPVQHSEVTGVLRVASACLMPRRAAHSRWRLQRVFGHTQHHNVLLPHA
jgi:hypothetical protein